MKQMTVMAAVLLAACAARAQVIELTARGLYALEETSGALTVSATSPAGFDLSHLRYCLCDAKGQVVARYGDAVGAKRSRLLVNLPAGDYTLRATDGTWFYGSVPVAVLKRDNRYMLTNALSVVEIHEPEPPAAPSGLARAWHDVLAFDTDRLDERQKRLAKDAPRTGWNRVAALCFEDSAAIGYDFAQPSNGLSTASLTSLIDRTAARMKFTGENLFVFPGAWCHGFDDENGNPRPHAPDVLSAWYAKFDHEGLFIMPTVNTNTPPNFNFRHPKVRKYIANSIDALLEQGADHPSFKGVALNITRHGLFAFGDEVTDFYVKQAKKLAAKRPDLRLWLNCMIPANEWHSECTKSDFMSRAWRAVGLDSARLTREAPNVILGQTVVPANTPSGGNALRRFVEPLRYGDRLVVSKVGPLTDADGRENGNALVPFLQAFRALPAVVMDDVAAVGDLRVRQCAFNGASYFYVVNTGLTPATVTLEFPAKTRNLVTGETSSGGLFGGSASTHTLTLAPCELRSYRAPEGRPGIK